MKPFLDSTDIAADGPELDRRMQRDGYLFIRGLLPADLLEDLRLQLLELAAAGGWVKAGTSLENAIADLDGFCLEPEPKYNEVYHRMYKLPDFHAIQHHPHLTGLLERMAGERIIAHPRIIGRTIFPQREAYTTPPHQDFVPIQGTAATYTAWFPLSTLTPEMGGLQIAAGSHLHGVYDIRPTLGAGGMEIIDPITDTWMGNPFAQGDVLFFHSMVVHQGVSNTGERLRMSMDGRYQKLSDPINSDSLLPHIKPVTWEEIYADWPSDQLQYYWKEWEMDLEFKEYDFSYFDKRDRLAFEMAARGDLQARSTLQRITARDKDAAKREKAAKLLAELDAAAETA
jgi:hypothetical protein